MFFSFLVLAFVFGTVRPLFNSSAVLLVLDPLTNISGPVCVFIGSVAMSLIIGPGSFINVSVSVYEYTVAIGLIVLPLSVVLAAVLPDLLPVAILHAVEQFSGVNGPIAESNGPIILPLVVIHHFTRNS